MMVFAIKRKEHLLIHHFLRQFLSVQKSDPNPANEKVKRLELKLQLIG